MKSIVEEASSILKAIEKAWIRAGNPREFSVKIFEDPQKSFFGLATTKQAKVGVFFEIAPLPVDGSPQRQGHPARDEQRHKRPERPAHTHGREQTAPVIQQRTPAPMAQSADEEVDVTIAPEHKKKHIHWNDEMLTAVSKWITDLLRLSNMSGAQPTLTVLDSRLIITFEKPLLESSEKTSDLYRSLSYLLIGMIRSRFKKEFRFLKIVLTDGSRDRDFEAS